MLKLNRHHRLECLYCLADGIVKNIVDDEKWFAGQNQAVVLCLVLQTLA